MSFITNLRNAISKTEQIEEVDSIDYYNKLKKQNEELQKKIIELSDNLAELNTNLSTQGKQIKVLTSLLELGKHSDKKDNVMLQEYDKKYGATIKEQHPILGHRDIWKSCRKIYSKIYKDNKGVYYSWNGKKIGVTDDLIQEVKSILSSHPITRGEYKYLMKKYQVKNDTVFDKYLWNIAHHVFDSVPTKQASLLRTTNKRPRYYSNVELVNGFRFKDKKFDMYDVLFVKEMLDSGKFDSKLQLRTYCEDYVDVSSTTIDRIINTLQNRDFDDAIKQYLDYSPTYKFKWRNDFLYIDFGDGIWLNSLVKKDELYEIIQCAANKNTRKEKMEYARKLQKSGILGPNTANFLVFNYNNKELCHMAKLGASKKVVG